MPTISTTGKASLDAFIETQSQDPGIPPFVFAVTSADGVIYTKAKGLKHADCPADGEVDIDTVFKVYSESKLITHIAALQLVEGGKLDPATPVADYIPAFKNAVVVAGPPPMPELTAHPNPETERKIAPTCTPVKEVMTVQHLMSYMSGLSYPFTGVPDWSQKFKDAYHLPHDPKDPIGGFLRHIQGDLPGIPLMFEPGTDWAYGYSSDILGFIVEKVSGLNLEQYMQKHIFTPLGMSRSSFYATGDVKENLTTIMLRREDGSLVPYGHDFYECDPEKVHAYYGGASIMCSTRDYLTLLRHLLQIHAGIANPDDAILKRETAMKLFTPSLPVKAQATMELFLGPTLPSPKIQWTNGQAVALADWPGMRKEGSCFWSGYLNTTHWVDPAAGIAGVIQSQLLPPLDRRLMGMASSAEGMLYSILE